MFRNSYVPSRRRLPWSRHQASRLAGLAPNLLRQGFNRGKDVEMNPSMKDQIEGAIHEVKGKAKETAAKPSAIPT